jgi:tellurite resistance protein
MGKLAKGATALAGGKKATDDVLLLHGLMLMGGADGVIEEAEQAMLQSYWNSLPEFREKDWNTLFAQAKKVCSRFESFKDSVKALAEIESPVVRKKLFVLAADMAMSSGDVDKAEDELLETMQPTYLEEKGPCAQLMRKILFNGGLLVASANGQIVESELAALRALLGADCVHANGDGIDSGQVRRELHDLLQQAVKEVPLSQRARLVQHLTIVGASDGLVDDKELATMTELAGKLKVDPSVIHQTLAGAARPMD